MFAKITAWFRAEVKTVEGILAGYLDTIKQLEQHEEAQLRSAFEHNEVVQAATAAANAAYAEADKAKVAAEKIRQVFA